MSATLPEVVIDTLERDYTQMKVPVQCRCGGSERLEGKVSRALSSVVLPYGPPSVAGLALAGFAVLLGGCGTSEPTFTRDLAPVVFARCAPCHHAGGAAPFSLLSYDDVRRRARQIADVTASRYMPPWLPQPGYGTFESERFLSANEIELFRRWATSGAVEGAPADLSPLPVWAAGWELGEPDVVVEMTEPFDLPAEGGDVLRNFVTFPAIGIEDRFAIVVSFFIFSTKGARGAFPDRST